MSPEDHRHGSWAGYVAGCRETCCREAARLYQKRRVYEGRPRRVPSLGLRRRVQALACLGWDMYAIAREAGTSPDTVRSWTAHATVMRSTHERMSAAYERLSMRLPPEETPGQKANAAKARNRARRNGWAPPLAFDNIDDPDEQPTGHVLPRNGRRADHIAARTADLEHFADADMSLEEAMRELGIDRDALWKWADRHGRLDLYERLARGQRRGENQHTRGRAA